MRPRAPGVAADIEGTLIRRGDLGYEGTRTGAVWNEATPRWRPDAIVRAATEADVVHAVAWARAQGLRVSMRSGGHNWSGSPLRDGGLLLDLSGLRQCGITPAHGTGPATAAVGPGATGQDLVAALTPQGLAFPVGHCPTVAVGGFLLSGGLGWNSRAWGASCADVREIRAVTADGRTVTCSDTEHPDLFWAARGAGPGFCAAVTGFRLALHPHPAAIMTAGLTFPLAEVTRVTDWAEPLARRLPPYVETAFVLASSGPATADAPRGPGSRSPPPRSPRPSTRPGRRWSRSPTAPSANAPSPGSRPPRSPSPPCTGARRRSGRPPTGMRRTPCGRRRATPPS